MTQPKQPQPPKQPDRASALQQIPPEMHPHAEAMAAAGLNWSAILAILQAILAGVGPLLKPPAKP